MREGKGNDDEAICAPASQERKSRLLRRPATAGLLAMTRSGLFQQSLSREDTQRTAVHRMHLCEADGHVIVGKVPEVILE